MSEFSVKGYESFHKNREHKKGGGVICCIWNTLNAIKIEKQDAEKYDTTYVEITAKKTKMTIAITYRPPKLQTVDDTVLYEEIKSVIQNKQIIIIGDLNCPNIDWATMNGDHEGNRLIEIVFPYKKDVAQILAKYFFSSRVTNHWNSLLTEVIGARTLSTFKIRFDRYFVATGVS